ncbi:hypothetical protein BDR26DRAFT_861869 [Obelidium mucronatum]|nr:hypothetical protein BDR26DRAFT_861869 [Obelidium mucronatum]
MNMNEEPPQTTETSDAPQPDAESVPLIPRTSTPYSLPSNTVERVNLRHRLPKPQTTPPTPDNQQPASESANGSSSTAEPSTKPDAKKPSTEEEEEGGMFECNICLDMASSPVVTLCGHLFCWPCLSRWITSRTRNSNTCPVCKAGIEKEKLIPIYCKGKTDDPRNSVPEERPAGQRPEAVPQAGFGGFFGGGGGGVGNPFAPGNNVGFNPFFGGLPGAQFTVGGTNIHFSAGFGPLGLLFPLLGMGYNFLRGRTGGPDVTGVGAAAGGVPVGNGAGVSHDARMAQVVAQQAFISRVFLLISALVFVAIVLY